MVDEECVEEGGYGCLHVSVSEARTNRWTSVTNETAWMDRYMLEYVRVMDLDREALTYKPPEIDHL